MATTMKCIMLLYLVCCLSAKNDKFCPQTGECRLDWTTTEFDDKNFANICEQFAATKHFRWSCRLVREDKGMNDVYVRGFKPDRRRSICNCEKATQTLYIVDAHGFYTKKSVRDWQSTVKWTAEMPVVLFQQPGVCMQDSAAREVRAELEQDEKYKTKPEITVHKNDEIHNYVYSGDAGFQDTSGIYQINKFRRGSKTQVQERLLYDVVQDGKKPQFFKLTDLAKVLTDLGGDATTPIYWLCCSSEMARSAFSLDGDIRKNVPKHPVITLNAVLQRRVKKRAQCKEKATQFNKEVEELKARFNLRDIKFKFTAGLRAKPKAATNLIKKEVPICLKKHQDKMDTNMLMNAKSHDIKDGHEHAHEWCWIQTRVEKLKKCLDRVVYDLRMKLNAQIQKQTAMIAADNMYDDFDDYDVDEDQDIMQEEVHSLAIRLKKKMWAKVRQELKEDSNTIVN